MQTLAIILARAGSRSIPEKCLHPVLGRPMIEYTFDHALAADTVHQTILTTDSVGAKALAARRGIRVIDRPPKLASDHATVDAAARHAAMMYEELSGRNIAEVVLLYANIPVRAAGVIDRAVFHRRETGADSVRTLAPIGKHHPLWLHRLEGDHMIQYAPNNVYRRQDLDPLYYHDGAVLVVTREALFSPATRGDDRFAFLGEDRRGIIQEPSDAVDVDEPFDILIAEALLRARALDHAHRTV